MQTFAVKAGGSLEQRAGTTSVLEERRFLSLDGWRGVAILMVFFYHYAINSHANSAAIRLIGWIAAGCWSGVDLFFVLSGFLITGILIDTREHKNYFRNFYARRALRIFPLYYAALFIVFCIGIICHTHWQIGHVAYFFYLGNIAVALNPALLNLHPHFGLDVLWSPNFHIPLASLFMHTCLAILFAKLLLSAIQPATLASKIGLVSVLRFFGKYSYGIYIFHRLFGLEPLLRFLQSATHSIIGGGILFFVTVFVLSTVAAVISYELFERHFLKLKEHFRYSAI